MGEVGLILEKTLPKIDLLLAAIILNGSNLMTERQRPGGLAKQRLFVQALNKDITAIKRLTLFEPIYSDGK